MTRVIALLAALALIAGAVVFVPRLTHGGHYCNSQVHAEDLLRLNSNAGELCRG